MTSSNPPSTAAPSPPPETGWDYVWVTPEKARRYLDTMHKNRTLSKIETAVMEMNLREGTFFPRISPVFVDDGDPGLDEDRAWDGQHRFEAIIATGVPVWLMFIRNVTEDEADHIDTGRRRMFSDNLKRHGTWNYKGQATLARYLALYDQYGIRGIQQMSSHALTQDQKQAFVDAPGMREAVALAQAIVRKNGGNDHLIAYAIMRTAEYGEPDAEGRRWITRVDPDGFWDAVRTGANLEYGDPALTLGKWLAQGRVRNRKPADRRLMELYALATAWNKHVLKQRYATVSPRFDKRATTGETFFSGSEVPDFFPVDADEKAKSLLRNARTLQERTRARTQFLAPAELRRGSGR